MLKSPRILRRVLKTWGDLLSLKPPSEKPSADAGVKKSKGVIIMIIIGSPNLGMKTRSHELSTKKKEKKICKIVDFAVPTDYRIKLKECEKRDKYLDLAKELKKLWNMKVTIIPIVIGIFGTVTKGLLKGLEDVEVGGRVETIQTTALLKTARILRRVLDTWGDLLSLNLQWKTISLRWCEKLWVRINSHGTLIYKRIT